MNIPEYGGYPVGTMQADLEVTHGKWTIRIRNLMNGYVQMEAQGPNATHATIEPKATFFNQAQLLAQKMNLTPTQIQALRDAWTTESAKDA